LLNLVADHAPYFIEQSFLARLAEMNLDLICSRADSFPHRERFTLICLLRVLPCFIILLQNTAPFSLKPLTPYLSFIAELINWEVELLSLKAMI